jgi:hypothetical protein
VFHQGGKTEPTLIASSLFMWAGGRRPRILLFASVCVFLMFVIIAALNINMCKHY